MVGSDSSLYSDTKQRNFFEQKNVKKKTKRAHAFEAFSSFYHVKILDYINRKLQLTDKIEKINSRNLQKPKKYWLINLIK